METVGLVSIVIVAHNDWPDLELAIQSALCQSYPKIEVIVVDNSSRDSTEQQVQGLFGNRITYVRQPNTGEGGGRNMGMRLAAGEFVQFLDGDDFLAPDKVEKQIAVLKAAPEVDIVYGDVRRFQTSAGRANWEDWDTADYPDMLATLLSFDGNGGGLIPDSLIFRRGALELIGPWVENPPSSDGAIHPYVGLTRTIGCAPRGQVAVSATVQVRCVSTGRIRPVNLQPPRDGARGGVSIHQGTAIYHQGAVQNCRLKAT